MTTAQTEVPPTTRTLERRDRISYEEFERDYLRRNRPVILTGCMNNWPALGKWSPEFFKSAHGSAPVSVAGQDRSLGEFIDMVLASSPEKPCLYLKDAVVRRIGTDLLRDIEPFLPYCFPNWLLGFCMPRAVRHHVNSAQIELFIGGFGTRLGEMHYDYIHTHTFLCQIFGRKQFTLFAPEDTPYLYATANQSAVKNPEQVDLERYPLFARATPYRFVQEPGEAVFLPSGWWHSTKLLTSSIAVGVNFANSTNWSAVVKDLGAKFAEGRPIRRALLQTYLSTLGHWKRLQGRWAGAKKLGIAPERNGVVS